MHWIDPDCLPETTGVVDRFLLNPEGEADGLVLTDGIEVHFPPHMGTDVVAAVRPGGAVRVRGVRPRGVAMVAAVSVAPEEGAAIENGGPPLDEDTRKARRKQARGARTTMEARGVLRQVLHGPRGEVRGLLLEDGRSGRFPPHAAAAVAPRLVPGTPVLLRGDGLLTQHGTVIAIREIGTSAEDMLRLDEPPRPRHGKAPKPHERGPREDRPKATRPV